MAVAIPHVRHRSFVSEVKQQLRPFCPQPVLNWREEVYYRKYGEIELHLVEFLCDRRRDAIDVGANEGCYDYWLRRYARHVIAFEPQPALAEALVNKFGASITVRNLALSREAGKAILRIPQIDGILIDGCASLSPSENVDALAATSASISTHRDIEVRTAALDDIYEGDVGFIKIDVEGFEDAVLDGAIKTIDRCRPNLLIEIIERMSPGGIARVSKWLGHFGYQGFYVRPNRLAPIETFDIQTMQRPQDAVSLTAELSARKRFPLFISNFVFLAADKLSKRRAKIDARLAQRWASMR
jgi:FkbM family methyltransferase